MLVWCSRAFLASACEGQEPAGCELKSKWQIVPAVPTVEAVDYGMGWDSLVNADGGVC